MATAVYQPSPRTLASKINGRKGGLARAAKLTASQRSANAGKAGRACLDAYGKDFYSYMRSRRKKKV